MPPVSSRTTMMSTPCSSSALIGEASSTAGCGTTGRRFANRPSALRSAQQPLLRAHRGGRVRPLRSADGAEQDRVGAPAQRQRRGRQRLAGRVDRGAADEAASKRESWPWRRATASSARTRLGGDLGADAVARQYRDQCASCMPCRCAAS